MPGGVGFLAATSGPKGDAAGEPSPNASRIRSLVNIKIKNLVIETLFLSMVKLNSYGCHKNSFWSDYARPAGIFKTNETFK